MRNWFSRLKLSRQLALVSCLFLLIPMLLLCYTVLQGQHSSAIQSRVREAQGRCVQAQAQVQRTAELCNMSTQVYLNTPALTGHLGQLKQGEAGSGGAAGLLPHHCSQPGKDHPEQPGSLSDPGVCRGGRHQ